MEGPRRPTFTPSDLVLTQSEDALLGRQRLKKDLMKNRWIGLIICKRSLRIRRQSNGIEQLFRHFSKPNYLQMRRVHPMQDGTLLFRLCRCNHTVVIPPKPLLTGEYRSVQSQPATDGTRAVTARLNAMPNAHA